VFAQLHEHARCRYGIDPRRYFRNATVLVRAQSECIRSYGMDEFMVLYDVYNIEAEALGQPLVFPQSGTPQLAGSRLLAPGTNIQDLRLNMSSAGWAGAVRFVSGVNRLVRRETGTAPPLFFTAPFSLAVQLKGYTAFVTELKRDSGLARHLLEVITGQVLVPWIRCLHDGCPDSPMAMGADAWGSLPNADLETWDRFIIPIYRYLKEILADEIPVGFVGYWGESLTSNPCGFINRKIEVAGPSFGGSVVAMDPDVERLGPIFFAHAARKLGRPLILGVDAALLRNGTPPDIARRVENYVESAKKEQVPVSILLADVSGDTPPENVLAAIGAAYCFTGS
jgi:hypothetical protein